MRLDLPEGKDTTYYLFDVVWECKIREIDRISEMEFKLFGNPTTGNAEFDRSEMYNWVDVMLPISEMVERFRKGVPIRIKYYDQTEQIYEYIQRHLEAWADRLGNGINIMAAPIDDLVAMNDFANSLFPYARAYIDTEATGSPFMRAISKAGFSKFSSEFFGTKEDSKEKASKERQDMSEVFKRARSTISSWSKYSSEDKK